MDAFYVISRNTYVFLFNVREQVQIIDAHGALERIEQSALLYPIAGPNGHIWFGRMTGSRRCHDQREFLRNEHLRFHDRTVVCVRRFWFLVLMQRSTASGECGFCGVGGCCVCRVCTQMHRLMHYRIHNQITNRCNRCGR